MQIRDVTVRPLPEGPLVAGAGAGAPCPNNHIEETITRLFELRGVNVIDLLPESFR